MATDGPVRLACAGVGGYAGAMCDLFMRLGATAKPPVKLVAVCEPDQTLHADRLASYRAAGIKVLSDYSALLTEPFDAVWLPVPIDLHRPFTEKALAAGKPVICEKPAAGCVDDLDAMIAARDQYKGRAAIAFQDIYDDAIVALKREIVGGTIGQIQGIALQACWPRGDNYYNRSSWAGKNKRNGVWVMDSPASNAIAHYINVALFLLGRTEREVATPVSIEAELYRVNPIETFDTCSLRVTVEGGATLLVLLTHASADEIHPTMNIAGARGRATYKMQDVATFESIAGLAKTISLKSHPREQMVQKLANWVRGVNNELVVTLEMARPHLTLVNGASEAAHVKALTGPEVSIVTASNKQGIVKYHTIAGIESAFAQCAASGKMLHESGLCSWSVPAGTKDLRNYRHFAGPKP